MNHWLLLGGSSLSLIAKLIAVLHLYLAYTKSGRRSSLLFSGAFLFAALQVMSDIWGVEKLTALMEAFAASLFFYATVTLLDEEFYRYPSFRSYLSVTPVVVTLYMLTAETFGSPLNWLATIGVAYAISGLFMVFAGLIVWNLRESYPQHVLSLSALFILYGLHEMDYPLLRPVEWFAPIGFSLSAVLTIALAYSVVRFVRSERFMELKPFSGNLEIELKPGVLLISPQEYGALLSKIKDFPVMAFLRDAINAPPQWMLHFVTQAPADNAVTPTNLARITETINRYLHSMRDAGKQGVVIIDCVEYLAVYNGVEAVIKLLSAIRDMALITGGTVIIVTDKNAWEEKDWKLLQRLVG
ncbi:DUF835 domain-containing protein [Palaeococcus ferrophilus]|uniref:DUF835 domain-containing protein n=1 Tax=Palaeococcus ferrophilus TaxID=83868 RepID=UPI00064E225C|nr:DUF835 domain-containing protein [Palaeococcus ferrophilus]